MGTRIFKIESEMAEVIGPEEGNPPSKVLKSVIKNGNINPVSHLSHVFCCNLAKFQNY